MLEARVVEVLDPLFFVVVCLCCVIIIMFEI